MGGFQLAIGTQAVGHRNTINTDKRLVGPVAGNVAFGGEAMHGLPGLVHFATDQVERHFRVYQFRHNG